MAYNIQNMGSNGGVGSTKMGGLGLLGGAGNFAQNYQQPKAPVAPTNQVVKSHTKKADGSVVQTYYAPEATGGATSSTQEGLIPNANASQGNVAVPSYGSQVTDTQGRTATAQFDPNTGKPLTNPNATAQDSTSGAPNLGNNGTPSVDYKTLNPTPNTFPGIIGAGVGASSGAYGAGSANVDAGTKGLLNTANDPQKVAGQYNSKLGDISQNETPAVIQARKELSDFNKNNPLMQTGIEGLNSAAEVAGGRGQLLGATLQGEHNALSTNVTNALAGEDQQIKAANDAAGNLNTAQNTGVTANTNVASTGTTGQGQGITGLNSNANLMQPNSNIIMRDAATGAVIGDQNLSDLAKLKGTLAGIESGASAVAGAGGNIEAQNATSLGTAGVSGQASNINTMTQAYQTGKNQIAAAQNLVAPIDSLLKANPSLNSLPVSALTNLNLWFSGQTSKPEQQQLSSLVHNYITELGLSPEQATAIAGQKGGTIGTLLNTFMDNKVTTNEALNPTNANKPSNTSTTNTSGSSRGNSIYGDKVFFPQ